MSITAESTDQEHALWSWEIVQRAQAGDTDAMGQLYATYHDVILRFINQKVATREIAEDLTGDVFVQAVASIGTITWQERGFLNWLYTMARHRVIDHYRRCRARPEILQPEQTAYEVDKTGSGALVTDEDTSPEGRPEETTLRHLEHVEMLKAFEHLSAPQRECLTLRYLEDRTPEETAEIMGRSKSDVKNLRHRGLRKLAEHLTRNGCV